MGHVLKWNDAHAWFRENWNEVACFVACVTLATAISGFFWWQNSWIPVTASCLVALTTAVCGFFALAENKRGGHVFSKQTRRQAVGVVQFLWVLMPISLAFVGSTSGDGVYVNPQTGITTADRAFIVAVPFLHSVVYVPNERKIATMIRVETQDAIPILCDVRAKGIVLDWRNPQKLGRFLAEIARNGDPELSIKHTLSPVLALSAMAALSQYAANDIPRRGELVIPYLIGTSLGEAFLAAHVQWMSGSISPRCKVDFQNKN